VSRRATAFLPAAAALTASVLRVGHRSCCVAADRVRARRLSRAPVALCSIRRYSHRVSSLCAAHRRPCRHVAKATRRACHGRLLLPPSRKRGAKRAHARGPLREASPVRLWAAHALCKPAAPVLCHWAMADSTHSPSIYYAIFQIYSNSFKVQKFV
jgi:hypothetical protein